MYSLSLDASGDFDGVAILKVHLDSYLTTYVLKTSTETLSIRYHNVYLTVVLLAVVGASVIIPGNSIALYIMY